MRKNINKVIAMTMATSLLISGASYTTSFQRPKMVIAQTQDDKVADKIVNEIKNAVTFSDEVVDKDETVYVITDANGNVTKKIVNDHLANKNGSNVLVDKSDLSDIENLKTDAGYTKKDDGTIEWEAGGEDIYYQGTTDKELPVDVKITYFLDDKEISPDDLAGKSGRVKIRFDYTNNAMTTVKIGGKDTKLFIPFTMISGTVLSDNFSNIEVSNGKVISKGDSNIVLGYAFPGLSHDINLSKQLSENNNIEFPQSFEISADVNDFSLLTTVTIGSADLLSSVDVDLENTKEDINSVLEELVSSTDKLRDGSEELSKGTDALESKFVEYRKGILAVIDAVSKINSGAAALDENMIKLVDGSKQIRDGIISLKSAFEGENGLNKGVALIASGMKTLDDGIDSLSQKVGDIDDNTSIIGAVNALTNGANQLAASVGSTNENEVKKDAQRSEPTTIAGAVLALTNGSNKLNKGVGSLKKGIIGTKDNIGLVAGINSICDSVGSSDMNEIQKDIANGNSSTLTAGALAVDTGVGQLVSGVSDMSQSITDSIADNKKTIESLNNAITFIQTYGKDPASGQTLNQEQITSMVTAYSTNIAALTGANQALTTVLAQMNQADLSGNLDRLKQGTQSLKNGTLELSKGMEQLKTGSSALSEGVTQLDEGSSTLYNGLKRLNTKMPSLTSGVNTLTESLSLLNSKMPELKEGVGALKNGSSKLKTGTDSLNKGVEALYDAIKEKLSVGASGLYEGCIEFGSGLSTLADGAETLDSKMTDLSDGTDKLENGIEALNNGAGQLNDGVTTLTQDAVGGAVDTYNNTLLPQIERIEKTVEAAKEYSIFTQSANEQSSKVKFIYRTDSIG